MPIFNSKGLSFTEGLSSISFSWILLSIVITLIQCGLAWGMTLILAYYDERKKRKDMEKINLKSELKLLRSQLNPHFIFNSLNNIDTLIHKDPQKASEIITLQSFKGILEILP